MTQLLPPKKEVALALLERSNVDVYLDPRAKGVVVPPQFRKEPRLILKIGLNMPVPIPDLRLDDESMSCTLSFNRNKFFCVVPWLSVFAMVGDDGRGMVWPDDVPQELAVRVVDEQRERGGDSSPQPVSKREGAPTSSKGGERSPNSKAGKSRLQPTDDSTPSERSGGPRSKKPRSKKPLEGTTKISKDENVRPMLHAVPAPPSSPSSSPRVEKLDERRDANANANANANSARIEPRAPAGNRPPPSARPKRELPPYLRVVK